MDIYLVFGFISEDGSDEGHTYIYGVFDDRVVAEEKKNKLEEALERDGSDERIYIKYLKIPLAELKLCTRLQQQLRPLLRQPQPESAGEPAGHPELAEPDLGLPGRHGRNPRPDVGGHPGIRTGVHWRSLRPCGHDLQLYRQQVWLEGLDRRIHQERPRRVQHRVPEAGASYLTERTDIL